MTCSATYGVWASSYAAELTQSRPGFGLGLPAVLYVPGPPYWSSTYVRATRTSLLRRDVCTRGAAQLALGPTSFGRAARPTYRGTTGACYSTV